MQNWPKDEELALLILARAVRTAAERRAIIACVGLDVGPDARPDGAVAADVLHRVRLSRLGDGKPSARVVAAAVAHAERDRAQLAELDGWIAGLWDDAFPALLRAIPDPPLWLFGRGSLALASARPQLAVVGARRSTRLSVRLAEQWCARLAANGVVITSGLAAGVDGAAHRGAVQRPGSRQTAPAGRTVAVVAHGVDRVYPRAHTAMAKEIIATGGVILSEYPPGVGPRPHHFPQRNRIISGLADAVLVVEATERSGSLITARLAAEQGRDVFAVPGNVLSGTHDGCHRLLRDGAALVCSPDEVLALLTQTGTWQPPTPAEPAPTRDASSTPDLADSLQRHIWQLCRREPSTVDELLTLVDQPTPAVLRALVHLELAGLLVVDGDCYSAVYGGT